MAEADSVSEPAGAGQSPHDWLLWPYLQGWGSPLQVGAAITAFLIVTPLAVGYAMEFLANAPPVRFPRLVSDLSMVVNGLLLGLLTTAGAYVYLGTRRDLGELRPLLRPGGPDLEVLIRETACLPAPLRSTTTVAGAVMGIAVALFDPRLRAAYAEISFLDPRFTWMVIQNALTFGIGLRLVATEIHVTRAYARLGARDVEIDLLDTSGLAPFVRKGLRTVMLAAVLSSVFSLYWVLDSAAHANVVIPFVVILIVTYAFLTPMVGLRGRIREAKRAELARIAGALREAREPLLVEGGGADPAPMRVADLVAYRSLIENVREWPFDLSALLRFLLFAALGVGSWLGGALVERALDRALG